MLNVKSHQPDHVKRAVSNTINTNTSICSNSILLQEAAESFKTRAQRNVYNPEHLNRVSSKPKKTPKHQAMQLGHSSNPTSPKFRKKSPRRIKTLWQACKDTTKCNICRNSPSTPTSHCSQKEVVYSIQCDLCHHNDAVYTSETSRPSSQRFQEQNRSAANPTAKSHKNMAFSKYYHSCYTITPWILSQNHFWLYTYWKPYDYTNTSCSQNTIAPWISGCCMYVLLVIIEPILPW